MQEEKINRDEPLVSVIVPYYNTEQFISETLRSILEQTYRNVEVICVNDGSTDNSESIVSTFKDTRLKAFSKKNTGVSDTRNYGYERSTGSLVLFMDADDLLSNDYLAKKVNYLLAHPGVGICSSNVIKIDETGKDIYDNTSGLDGDSALMDILFYNKHVSTCPSIYLIRKELIEEYQVRFNVELFSSADRFYLVTLLPHTNCMKIEDGAILFYRVHPGSMTGSLNLKLIRDHKEYVRQLVKYNLIPSGIKRQFFCKINYIFAGSYYHLKMYLPSFIHAVKSMFFNPYHFSRYLFKLQ